MKLNNKGFAISSIMYLVLVLAIALVLLTLSVFSSRKLMLSSQKESVIESILNGVSPSSPILPEGYTYLEYIESDGTQYINTGVIVNRDDDNSTSLEMDIEFISSGWMGVNGYMQILYNSDNNTISTTSGSPADNSFEFTKNRNTVKVIYDNFIEKVFINNAEQQNLEHGWSWYSNSNSRLYLFAMGNTDNSLFTGNLPIQAKLYSAKVYEGEELVRIFIPCLNPLGTEGLYDLKNGIFYPFMNINLNGYEILKYIESDGTQHINTGVNLVNTDSSKLDLDIEFTGDNDDAFFGANCFLQLHYNGPNKQLSIRSTNLTPPDPDQTPIEFTGRGIINIEQYQKIISLHANNQESGDHKEWGESNCNSNNTLFLFAMGANEYLYPSSPISAKLYSAKVEKNNTLERNFIPCKKSSTNAIGLCDLVNNQFYSNNGTGNFIIEILE